MRQGTPLGRGGFALPDRVLCFPLEQWRSLIRGRLGEFGGWHGLDCPCNRGVKFHARSTVSASSGGQGKSACAIARAVPLRAHRADGSAETGLPPLVGKMSRMRQMGGERYTRPPYGALPVLGTAQSPTRREYAAPSPTSGEGNCAGRSGTEEDVAHATNGGERARGLRTVHSPCSVPHSPPPAASTRHPPHESVFCFRVKPLSDGFAVWVDRRRRVM